MRRSTYLIFINAMILIVVFGLMAQSVFIIKRLAKATTVSGQVLVQRGGQNSYVPLAQGDFVKTEDLLKTGPDGKAEFKWADGTRLHILPNSDLTIKKASYNMAKKAEESQFILSNGTIFVRIVKALAPQSKFEVETPTAVAAVRGTIFMVKVQNGKTQVAVSKGSVRVSSGAGDNLRESMIMPGRVAISGASGQVETTADPQAEQAFAALDNMARPSLSARILPLRNNERALVQGRTEAGNSVTVNGKAVDVFANGAFSYRVKLKAGENSFTVVARDKHDSTSQITKSITVP